MNKLGQFLIGFAIAFSPAPFIGMGTYAYVQGQAPSSVVTAAPQRGPAYGSPLDYEFGEAPQFMQYETGEHAPASVEPHSGGSMEVETDCARRKRAKKAPEKKPEKPPVPEL